jgi:hypothetical protein
MYQGAERRMTPRHRSPASGLIWLEGHSRVECTVRDFSPAGAGLLINTVALPNEFDLTFDRATRHCVALWRQPGRLGLKFKSARSAAILTFVKDKAFGPDDIEIMDAAFQLVCRLLKLTNRHGDARSTAAVMIIELMARGQRNPSTLAYAAIRELEHGSTGRH